MTGSISRFKLGLFLGATACALAQSPGAFTATGSMISPRANHTATLLNNGKVLVTGGQFSPGGSGNFIVSVLSSAELYDPSTGSFAATGNMSCARVGHTATLLATGQVLIAGGQDADFRELSAELYDPSTGTFTATGSMTAARAGHTATLLNDGKVLLTGGFTVPPKGELVALLDSAEIYDPSTGTFIPTVNMNQARAGHSATLLSNGTVLIDGGNSQGFLSGEIYDPADGTFRKVVGTPYDNSWPPEGPSSATLLPAGNVLFTLVDQDPETGTDSGDTTRSTALYNPSTVTFSPAPDLTEGWVRTATLLGDGTVFIAGLNYSYGLPNFTSHADVYDPVVGTVTATGNMIAGRISHTATLLPDGTVLVAGGAEPDLHGIGGPWSWFGTAELYLPTTLIPSPVLSSLAGGMQGAIWHNTTGQLASPSSPAVAGEVLAMYTNNLIEGGVIPPQVIIGGHLAEVLYFGDAPGYPGFFQVNFRVPNGVAPGSAVSVRLTYIERPSNQVSVALQ
ncbi:MAG TPA: kelch repeat-containing protein [Bryobacteraceae bacterium]|nr:kelch repeat-containing protein [Bryobacteraceae bacterium]